MLIKKTFWTPQFLYFGLIGVANTVIHGFMLTMMIKFFFLNVVLGNLLGFFVANLFSYFMNSMLTFKIKSSFILYYRFLLTSLFSLGLTLFIAWVMNHLGFHYLEGFLVVIFIVPTLNFLTVKFWAFSVKSS